MSVKLPLKVFIISDSAGETGESVTRAAAAQFPDTIKITRIPFVDKPEDVDLVIAKAKEEGAAIVFTIVIPELKKHLLHEALRNRVECIDVLGPVVQSFEKWLGQESRHQPGMIHRLDEEYFKRVEAVEFAVKYDDGRDSRGILEADIVLVGVSRTSKTPLSMFLAHKTYKVANVPLVPEIKPPKELFNIPSEKIVGLTISEHKLNSIRKERLKSLGLAPSASYADINRIREELKYSDAIMEKLGCVVIDVSNKAVEETAGRILELFRK